MTTLPKEIEEEMMEIIENECTMAFYTEDVIAFIRKVYTTARRQALTDGIASLGEWECICLEGQKHNLVCWKGQEYRAEAIAKLTQLRDV